jgi:hypothetical protein
MQVPSTPDQYSPVETSYLSHVWKNRISKTKTSLSLVGKVENGKDSYFCLKPEINNNESITPEIIRMCGIWKSQ